MEMGVEKLILLLLLFIITSLEDTEFVILGKPKISSAFDSTPSLA